MGHIGTKHGSMRALPNERGHEKSSHHLTAQLITIKCDDRKHLLNISLMILTLVSTWNSKYSHIPFLLGMKTLLLIPGDVISKWRILPLKNTKPHLFKGGSKEFPGSLAFPFIKLLLMPSSYTWKRKETLNLWLVYFENE